MKFYVSSLKSEIVHFDGLILSKSCTVSGKKIQLSLITLNSHPKFKEKPTFCLKTDMRYLMNFNLSSEQSENLHFYGIFLSKVCNV